jgi:hypothetical protein
MLKIKLLSVVTAAVVAVPVVALADESADIYSYAWHDSHLASGYGISTTLGGGLTGFTDQTMRDVVTSNTGGLWDLRVVFGSHTPLALDVGYIGTAQSIDALTGTQNATLVGTSVEGALRWNILPHFAWNPYVFAGVGWQRYDITGAKFTMADSGINDSDNSVVFPLGTGISYRAPNGLVVDLKGTFRANTQADLVIDTTGNDSYAPLHTWEASTAIGYEF